MSQSDIVAIIVGWAVVGFMTGILFTSLCESRSPAKFTNHQGFGTMVISGVLWPVFLLVLILEGVIWLVKGFLSGVKHL